MDEQQTVDIQALQDQYLEAMVSGDQDKIKSAKDNIESVLSGKPVENKPAEPTQEEVVDTDPESLESGEEQELSGGEPVTKEGEHPPQEQKQNWMESLDPSIRKEVEKIVEERKNLEHRLKSDDGRVAAYQRKSQEADRRYNELQKKAVQQEEMLKSLQAKTAQPQGKPAAPKPTSIQDDPDLKAIAETDEQLALVMWKREQALREGLDELREEVEKVRGQFTPLVQGQEQMRTEREISKLVQIVPNAIEIFNYKDPDSGINYWDEWIQRVPPKIREAALSDDAEDVAYALQIHIAEMQRYFGFDKEPQGDDSAETTPQQENGVNQGKLDAVQRERQRKLQAQPVGQASVRPPQKKEPTLSEIAADPELLRQYQDKIYKEEMKKKGYTY